MAYGCSSSINYQMSYQYQSVEIWTCNLAKMKNLSDIELEMYMKILKSKELKLVGVKQSMWNIILTQITIAYDCKIEYEGDRCSIQVSASSILD